MIFSQLADVCYLLLRKVNTVSLSHVPMMSSRVSGSSTTTSRTIQTEQSTVPSTLSRIPGTRYLLGTVCLEPGTRYLVPDIRYSAVCLRLCAFLLTVVAVTSLECYDCLVFHYKDQVDIATSNKVLIWRGGEGTQFNTLLLDLFLISFL